MKNWTTSIGPIFVKKVMKKGMEKIQKTNHKQKQTSEWERGLDFRSNDRSHRTIWCSEKPFGYQHTWRTMLRWSTDGPHWLDRIGSVRSRLPSIGHFAESRWIRHFRCRVHMHSNCIFRSHRDPIRDWLLVRKGDGGWVALKWWHCCHLKHLLNEA